MLIISLSYFSFCIYIICLLHVIVIVIILLIIIIIVIQSYSCDLRLSHGSFTFWAQAEISRQLRRPDPATARFSGLKRNFDTS